MIKQIYAKKILSHSKKPDPWFGIKYGMNLYRGCQHQCIYCDSRSECYQIDNFHDIHVKVNAIELLEKELDGKRVKGTVGTGSMNDPYMPIEKELKMTRKALEVIKRYCFPVHVITKSNLVVRDTKILKDISKTYAAVSFTITTTDDNLAKKIEPGAPLPSERFKAVEILASAGIYTGITMMPILPFLEDSVENIQNIVEKSHKHGARYIIPAFGMTLRDRQRVYYYEKLDKYFPGISSKYKLKFGEKYGCAANESDKLKRMFKDLCKEYKIDSRMKKYEDTVPEQLSMFMDKG